MAETAIKLDGVLRLRVPKSLVENLRDVAWEQRTTMSYMAREAIQRAISEHRDACQQG